MSQINLYTVETEEGIVYEGVFAATKIEAARKVAETLDPNDEILEVHRTV
ncbi:hypothetical protein ACIGPN_06080 [Streptomyces afghaniensis]